MRLYWVRHGQMAIRAHTVGDLELVNQLMNQQTERGLSDRGRREADAVAQHFRHQPPDVLFTSPLSRARETAEATASALGQRVKVLPDLAELRTGHLPRGSAGARLVQGLTSVPLVPQRAREKLLASVLIPLYFESWRAGRTEGGESRASLEGRIEATFGHLRALYPADARVALFAHGYVIFYLSAALVRPRHTRLRAWLNPYIPNASITEMELGAAGPPRLLSFARTGHL